MSAEDRREQLVDAAIRVMTRDGVARATTRAIAGEAGLPLGVLHYAFHSKQELMTVVTEAIARRSKADIDAAVLTEGRPDLFELVLAGLSAYFDHVVEHPDQHLVTYEVTTMALRGGAELGDAAKRQYEYYLEENEKLMTAVAGLVGLEFVEPVPVVSRYVFSAMDGLALNWLARGDETQARQVLRLLARTLLGMTRPRATDPTVGP
jgi:AcrR family transcriptional regulator